jgi:hypothetical protein
MAANAWKWPPPAASSCAIAGTPTARDWGSAPRRGASSRQQSRAVTRASSLRTQCPAEGSRRGILPCLRRARRLHASATSAEHAEARARQEAHLRGELARIDAAEHGLITELGTACRPGRPGRPGVLRPDPRPLHRAVRPADPHRSPAQSPPGRRTPGQRPVPAGPAACRRRPVRRRPGPHPRSPHGRVRHLGPLPQQHDQVTIRAALTDDTPRTITALLDDPRTDSDTASIAPGQDPVYHSAPAPMGGAVTLNHRAGRGSLPHHRGLGRVPWILMGASCRSVGCLIA